MFGYLPLLTAQYDKLLNNKSVIWAAEVEVDYRLTKPSDQVSYTEYNNDIQVWKCFDPSIKRMMDSDELLMNLLLNAALSGDWPAWSLDSEPRMLSLKEIQDRLALIDTVTVLDMGSGLTRNVPIMNEPDLASFSGIRARHLLWFDHRNGNFNLYTSAIAMIRTISVTPKNGGYEEEQVMFESIPFWFRMPPLEETRPIDINKKQILWAAQVRTVQNTPVLSDAVILKNTEPPAMQALLGRFRFDENYQTENVLGEKIVHQTRESMVIKLDTFVTFDPETYEEKVVVRRHELTGNDLKRLQLVQIWAWDDRKKRLQIRLDQFAPIVENFDFDGNFRFWEPLFIRRLK